MHRLVEILRGHQMVRHRAVHLACPRRSLPAIFIAIIFMICATHSAWGGIHISGTGTEVVFTIGAPGIGGMDVAQYRDGGQFPFYVERSLHLEANGHTVEMIASAGADQIQGTDGASIGLTKDAEVTLTDGYASIFSRSGAGFFVDESSLDSYYMALSFTLTGNLAPGAELRLRIQGLARVGVSSARSIGDDITISTPGEFIYAFDRRSSLPDNPDPRGVSGNLLLSYDLELTSPAGDVSSYVHLDPPGFGAVDSRVAPAVPEPVSVCSWALFSLVGCVAAICRRARRHPTMQSFRGVEMGAPARFFE